MWRMVKPIALREENRDGYIFQDISIDLLKKQPELIVSLAKSLYEDICFAVANSGTYNPILDLRRSSDIDKFIHIILSNCNGLKRGKGNNGNTLFSPITSTLLASVIGYVIDNENNFDKSLLGVTTLLLKQFKKTSGSIDISDLDVLLQTTTPELSQTYTYKNYELFKTMCNKCLEEEMACIDALLMIRNFSHLIMYSNPSGYSKIEDNFQNDDFIIRTEDKSVNNVDSVIYGRYLIKLNIYFKNKKIDNFLKNSCFTFELVSPNTIKFIDSVKFRNFISIDQSYNFGSYSKTKNNKEIIELFTQVNNSLDKLLSPDYLDEPLAYNILMNTIKQNKIREFVITVS